MHEHHCPLFFDHLFNANFVAILLLLKVPLNLLILLFQVVLSASKFSHLLKFELEFCFKFVVFHRIFIEVDIDFVFQSCQLEFGHI